MKRTILLIFILPALANALCAQEFIIHGRVIDKKSRQPIIAANLVLPDGSGAYSTDGGQFSLKVDAFPVKIKISHISYGNTEIILNYAPDKEVIVELEELVEEIGEVQITAKRLRILTEKEDFSIQDFAFDNEYLWLLGYTNNQAGKGKLWLANWFGDTLTSIPVSRPESLYRDVFGSVHLVLKDSVYQLFTTDRKIVFAYAVSRTDFFSLMEPIRAGFAGKLAYADINSFEQKAVIYFREAYVAGKQMLTIVEDEIGRRDRRLEIKVGSMWTEYSSKNPVKRGTKVSSIISNTIKVPIFSWKDTLFVINMLKDSLLSFTPEGKFKRAVPFSYCTDTTLSGLGGEPRYRNISILADPAGKGMYILERKGFSWILLPLDPNTGSLSTPVTLPEFPDMYRISICGNAAYFLYPEKKWPYFVRLYRYQL
jgi:hypothetical protein